MKLDPQMIPLPKIDGRGGYERSKSKLVLFLGHMQSGTSFTCTLKEYERVRKAASRFFIKITSRKLTPKKFRVWKL